jgi:hypothetical protein
VTPDLSDLMAEAAGHAWFAATGDALTPADRADASAAGSGLPVEAVADWSAAKALLGGSSWDHARWRADDAERRRLFDLAASAYGRTALLKALSDLLAAAGTAEGAAAVAVARAGLADPGLIKVASGALAEALDRAAVAQLAAAGDHRFVACLRLYRAGRWPLGVFGGRFALL